MRAAHQPRQPLAQQMHNLMANDASKPLLECERDLDLHHCRYLHRSATWRGAEGLGAMFQKLHFAAAVQADVNSECE